MVKHVIEILPGKTPIVIPHDCVEQDCLARRAIKTIITRKNPIPDETEGLYEVLPSNKDGVLALRKLTNNLASIL